MKKLVALFVAFLFATPLASAVFTDVPEDAWYYGYVQQLVEDGVIDEGDNFRPADPLNRAEFVKIVITATNGLEGYEAPPIATFDDVSEDAWYYPYVESAVQLGIVSGYTDAQGNLTGRFGPNDTVTRASAAKILVNAFGLPTTLSPASPFSDVDKSAWYHDFVVTAYNQSVLDGYDNGAFGAADPVTRAQIAKLVVNAASPILRERNVEPEPDGFMPADDEQVGVPLEPEPDSTVPSTTPVGNQETFVPYDTDGESGLVLAGTQGKYIGSYRFYGGLEDFIVNKLTIVNDLVGNQMGDQMSDTNAIKSVVLVYKDKNNAVNIARGPMSGGQVTFSGLEAYIPKKDDAMIDVYADINPMSAVGSSLSGKKFRLGLRDIGNTASTFEAIGQITSTATYLDGMLSAQMLGGSLPSEFVVRAARPIFSLASADTSLTPGTHDLLKFNVTAEGSGGAGLARLVFDISATAGVQLNEFQLLRGSSVVNNVSIMSGGADVAIGGVGTVSGVASVIIAFNQEETVSAGSVSAYTLRANVGGTVTDASVNTRIATGDDASELTPNTDQLTGGIFADESAFRSSVGGNTNIIWSDRSAESHQYNLAGGGSSDWTNGHFLQMNSLNSHTLSN